MENNLNTSTQLEEQLENMKNTRDINVYLDMLSLFKDRYLIIVCVKDTFYRNISEETLDKLHNIGFTKITGSHCVMYIGICENGHIIFDKSGEKPNDEVTFTGNVSGLELSILSKSWSNGNSGKIIINGTNYSLDNRGLNIVVYDPEASKAVDVMVYDPYVDEPIFYHRSLEYDDDFFKSHFYIYPKYNYLWQNAYVKKFFDNRALNVCEVKKGIILPNKNVNGVTYGGVCDEKFKFVSGHKVINPVKNDMISRHITDSYSVLEDDMVYIDETVVYGGTMLDHPGHIMIESFAERIWWFLKNPGSTLKVAIVNIWGDGTARFTREFLNLFGIPDERIIICAKPTKFKSIIVPEQSEYGITTYEPYGFTKEFADVYRHVRDSVTPSPFKKIYFTKTKTNHGNIVGEEWFIEFYRKKGFKIINPEDYSLREKVEFLAGADEFVSQTGTNSLYALFCKPSVKLTIFSRMNNNPYHPMSLVVEAMNITDFYCVDVSRNFLHKHMAWGISVLAVTDEFKRYVKEVYNEELDITAEEALKDILFDYIKKFPEYYSNPFHYEWIKNQKMLTILQYMSEVFWGKEFDTSRLNLTTNEDNLAEQVRQLTTDLNNAKGRVDEVESTDVFKAAQLLSSVNAKFEAQLAAVNTTQQQTVLELQNRIEELISKNGGLERSLNLETEANKQRDAAIKELSEKLISAQSKEIELKDKIIAQEQLHQKQTAKIAELEKKIYDYEQLQSKRGKFFKSNRGNG